MCCSQVRTPSSPDCPEDTGLVATAARCLMSAVQRRTPMRAASRAASLPVWGLLCATAHPSTLPDELSVMQSSNWNCSFGPGTAASAPAKPHPAASTGILVICTSTGWHTSPDSTRLTQHAWHCLCTKQERHDMYHSQPCTAATWSRTASATVHPAALLIMQHTEYQSEVALLSAQGPGQQQLVHFHTTHRS